MVKKGYKCEVCDYETNKKYTYNRHISSAIHLRRLKANSVENEENTADETKINKEE